jgi:hypothetical protein
MNLLEKNVQSINDIQALNEKNIFLVYTGKSNKNLLIISACRLSAFAYYFSQITDYNIYMIYIIPFIRTAGLLDETKVREIVKNTDVIVCESITNVDPFKTTVERDPSSFFSIFGVDFNKTKVYAVPNFELHYLSHWMYHNHNIECTPKILYDKYIISRDILFKNV